MRPTVVIHQPDFLPYLGFFHRFLHADLWVVLDCVQFLNNSKSWHNRDKIKTPDGERWITVAVRKCPQKTEIREVVLSEGDWREKSLNLLRTHYRKAPHFAEIFPRLEELYHFRCERMIEFNLRSIDLLLDLLDVRIERVFASELNPSGRSNELLVDILEKVGSTSYLSGLGARSYFDPAPYQAAGIEVLWQQFSHPVYPQLHGDFIPFLSCIDVLFNCGREQSRRILRNC